MYTVGDAMTPAPITVKPDDVLAAADTLMKHGRMRHLPVVHHGKLVGLLTKSDVLRALAARPHETLESLRVRDVMVTDAVTTHASLPLRRAARLLFDRKFGCLPVIDDQRHLVGILTETDFIRFAADMIGDLDRVEATATRLQQ